MDEEDVKGNKEEIIFTWSGGKDSAMALYEIMGEGRYNVKALLTTITEDYGRISMHGVRRELLREQADAIGIPLKEVLVSRNGSNEEYELRMGEALRHFKREGIDKVAFGDIFLEDLRRYREENLAREGLKGLFPLWKRDTKELSRGFIKLGFKAVIVCVDGQKLAKTFAGREFDEKFLSDLPDNIDPCGENGEFHTFVYDGPIFKKRIEFSRGEIVMRGNHGSMSLFYFCDILPLDSGLK